MTVVLSLVCADGVVIAADSQITDSGGDMTYPGRKLHPLGDQAVWGGSGARSVLLDLVREFELSSAAILESEDVARALQERVVPVLRHHYERYIEHVPGEETNQTPSASMLAAGYTHDGPWIVKINPNGLVNRYEDIGFHAIGTAAPMAQQAGALLAHFRMVERTIEHGVVAAVRVLDALAQTSPSVGGPLDVYHITTDGAHHLAEDEITEARGHVRRWSELEERALDQLFA